MIAKEYSDFRNIKSFLDQKSYVSAPKFRSWGDAISEKNGTSSIRIESLRNEDKEQLTII